MADAGGGQAAHRDVAAEGDGAEHADLVGGVDAVDVERGFGLGVALLLGLGEDLLERPAVALHRGEDVVAGAVEDADHLVDAVGGEAFADRLDDRDAPADAGLEAQVDAVFFRGGVEFRPVFGEQGLVGGDDRFAGAEGFIDELPGDADATDQFDDDLDVGVLDDRHRVGCADGRIQPGNLGGVEVQIRHPAQLEREARAIAEVALAVEDKIRDPRANVAEAQDADADFKRVVHNPVHNSTLPLRQVPDVS